MKLSLTISALALVAPSLALSGALPHQHAVAVGFFMHTLYQVSSAYVVKPPTSNGKALRASYIKKRQALGFSISIGNGENNDETGGAGNTNVGAAGAEVVDAGSATATTDAAGVETAEPAAAEADVAAANATATVGAAVIEATDVAATSGIAAVDCSAAIAEALASGSAEAAAATAVADPNGFDVPAVDANATAVANATETAAVGEAPAATESATAAEGGSAAPAADRGNVDAGLATGLATGADSEGEGAGGDKGMDVRRAARRRSRLPYKRGLEERARQWAQIQQRGFARIKNMRRNIVAKQAIRGSTHSFLAKLEEPQSKS